METEQKLFTWLRHGDLLFNKLIAKTTITILLGCYVFFAADTALAVNGYIQAQSCASCSTISDFKSSAYNYLLRYRARTVLVTSQAYAKSAYVKFTGTSGDLGTVTNANGQTLTSDGDLTLVDYNLFGRDRKNPLVVDEPEQYATSIIGSLDEEVGPGITYALTLKGVNVALIPVNTTVTVKFKDGTTAIFVKARTARLCGCGQVSRAIRMVN